MTDIPARLTDNLRRIEDRIRSACDRAGRPRAAVTLVAVTKTVPPQIAALLPPLGIPDLGENRPQELWRKAQAIPDARWHFIGHLQRNKIERTLPLVRLIHSIDSLRLLDALEAAAVPVEGFLEFNCSREASKGGFEPNDVESLFQYMNTLSHVKITGVMTMAAPVDDPELARPTFARLRALGEQLRVPHLSMGMSGDFEAAILEGSTHLRLGSILFEGIA